MKYLLLTAMLLPAYGFAECSRYHYSVDTIDKMRDQVRWSFMPHFPRNGFITSANGTSPSAEEIETQLRTYMCNGTTLKELERKDAIRQKAADGWGEEMARKKAK